MKAFNSNAAELITGAGGGGGGGGTFSGGFSTMGNTAGDTGVKTDRMVLVGSNNITLSGSTNGGSITISILGAGGGASTLTFFATGNTTQSSSGTINSTSIILRGSNIVSVGISNGSLVFDATQSNQAFSAAGGSSAFQTFSFSDNAQASFTNNAGQLAITNVRLSASATGNTTQSSTGTINLSSIILRGSNQVSVGVSNGSFIFDATTAAQTNQQMTMFATGNTTQSSTGTSNASSLIFRGDGLVSVGITNGSIEISGTQSNQAFSAAGGASAFQTLSFSDNAVGSWTNTAGQVALTNVRLSMYATSNTTQSSTGTADVSSLIFRGAGVISVGVTGGSVVISGNAAAGDGGVYAGVSTGGNTAGSTGTVSTGNFVLVGSNNITLSQSTGAAGSAATVTILGPTLYSGGVSTGGNTAGSTGLVSNQLVYVGTNGIFLSQSTGGVSSATLSIAGWPMSSYFFNNIFNFNQTYSATGSSSLINPFQLDYMLSVGFMRQMVIASVQASTTFATTGNTVFSAGASETLNYVLYTRGTGASSMSLQSVTSTSLTQQHSFNISAAANSTEFSVTQRYTFQGSAGTFGITRDYSTSQTNIPIHTSHITDMSGVRAIDVQFGISLTPGQYWLAGGRSVSTATQFNSAPIRFNPLYSSLGGSIASGFLGAFGNTASSWTPRPFMGSFSIVGGGTTASIDATRVSSALQELPLQMMRIA